MTLEHRWIQERVVNFVQKKKRKRKKDPGELFKSTPHLCKFSSLGWKHCSRHDLILLNISERDSLFSQCLLEALVREKLEEKSIFWEALEKPFSISGSICFRTGSCSVAIRSIMTLKSNIKPSITQKNLITFS